MILSADHIRGGPITKTFPVTAEYRQGPKPPNVARAEVCKRFRVTPTLNELIMAAAQDSGQRFSEWVRDACIKKLNLSG